MKILKYIDRAAQKEIRDNFLSK